MVLWGKSVAHIVQERADDPVNVGTFGFCPCGRLQAMFKARDLIAFK